MKNTVLSIPVAPSGDVDVTYHVEHKNPEQPHKGWQAWTTVPDPQKATDEADLVAAQKPTHEVRVRVVAMGLVYQAAATKEVA